MPERVFRTRGESRLVDELGGDQFVNTSIDSQAGQQSVAKARSDDRGGGKRFSGRRGEPVDASVDGRLQRCRNTDLADVGVAGVAATGAAQNAALGKLVGALLPSEKVARGPAS